MTNAIIDVNSINTLMKHCKSLLKLSLESLELDNQTFVCMSSNEKLETLNLSSCKGFSTEGVVLLLESFKMFVS